MNRIVLDQRKQLPITLAARSNLVPLTAWGYELWRKRSLSVLSGRNFPLAEELELLVNSVQPVTGLQFADLGTSTGLYSRALLCVGAEKVFALDLSLPMLKVAMQKVEAREWPADNWRLELKGNNHLYNGFVPIWARAEAIPLPDSSLDGVVVGGSWNEFPDPNAVVLEMYRVLKPSGRIFIMFGHRSDSPLQRLFELAGLRFPTVEQLQQQLETAGFATKGWREKSVGFVSGYKIEKRLNG